MADKTGIWHKTTLQSANLRQQTYHKTTLAGQKRGHDALEPEEATAAQPAPKRHAAHASEAPSFPKLPPRLSASIVRCVAADAAGGPGEYTQRRAIAATPTVTQDPLLSLSHRIYGLPPQLVENFASLGVRNIYPWQKQCLLGPGLLDGERNLVYSAPTGAGKSLVADVLMLKKVIQTRDAKALLVLPYVALVQEKVRWLRNVVQGIPRAGASEGPDNHEQRLWAKRGDAGTIRVVAFFGGSKLRATWQDFDIAVCTMEKANALVNTAISDYSITNLKAVVLDEIHMVDDGYRGYLLELMATKLLCIDHRAQIIGMSATLMNIDLLAQWLEGHSYETHYRPIPVEEHLVYEGNIYPAETTSRLVKTTAQLNGYSQTTNPCAQAIRSVDPSAHAELQDAVLNAVVALAVETATSGYGALVFSSSRAMCERDAVLISRAMPDLGEVGSAVLARREDLLGELRSLTVGLDKTLEQTIPAGVAFHHAGITTEERELVASAYDSGILKVCVATCSLAAGINLPARRVILHGARMGRDLVEPSMLRQMKGRAGRKGKDEVGETYLCCKKQDLDDAVDLMHADLPEIASSLISGRRQIRRALLEVIAVRLATSRESLDEYIGKTLLYHSSEAEAVWRDVEASLLDLQEMGFITIYDCSTYVATRLGGAIVASALDPEDGVFIHKELERALKAFVLDGEMHVLYTFTPVNTTAVDINWKVFCNEMDNLDESGLRVLGFLGLKPTVVINMLHGGTLSERTNDDRDIARVYHRFYMALQLRDLCNEMPIHKVAQKYMVPRGSVQTLAQTCQGFSAGMIKFCEHMGWGVMAAALDHFSDRLRAGAKADLLSLAKITFVKSRTARVFWDNGFKSVAAIANADPAELVPILLQAQPNKVRLAKREDEEKFHEKLVAKAKVITDSANRLWQMQMREEMDEE